MTTKTTKEDFEMANYILTILKSDITILMSWGFHNPTVIKDGLQMHVSGYIHKGIVQIIYQHGLDLFQVRLLLMDGTIVKEINEVYVEDLIDLIDENIEKVRDYNIYILQTLKNTKSHSN